MTSANTGIVNIRGKEYQTVAYRVHQFRDKTPLWSLTTEILFCDDSVVRMRATIADEVGRIIATGHAEEYRKASEINKTSAVENCETSAIGRALAAAGFGGTEFATANELEKADRTRRANVPGAGSPRELVGKPEFDALDIETRDWLTDVCAKLEAMYTDEKRRADMGPYWQEACPDDAPNSTALRVALSYLMEDSGPRNELKRQMQQTRVRQKTSDPAVLEAFSGR